MDESTIRTVSLFFYLNFFDTKQAFGASQKTLAVLRSHGARRSDIIPVARKVLHRHRHFRFFSGPKQIGEFLVPQDVDLQPWRDFKRRAEDVEYETVLLSQVLGFSDREIADGIGVTEGTVRHRLSRGLRELGRRL